MKLPRWLVIVMLTTSVMSVLSAAGRWWVTWPERTAREFVDLMAMKKWEVARGLQARGSPDPLWPEIIRPEYVIPGWNQKELRPNSRSWMQILGARQDFEMENGWRFTIERGQIVFWKTGFPERRYD